MLRSNTLLDFLYFSPNAEEPPSDELLVVNILAMVLIVSVIVASYVLSRVDLKYHDRILVDCDDDMWTFVARGAWKLKVLCPETLFGNAFYLPILQSYVQTFQDIRKSAILVVRADDALSMTKVLQNFVSSGHQLPHFYQIARVPDLEKDQVPNIPPLCTF